MSATDTTEKLLMDAINSLPVLDVDTEAESLNDASLRGVLVVLLAKWQHGEAADVAFALARDSQRGQVHVGAGGVPQ